jgi:hypothetical protein
LKECFIQYYSTKCRVATCMGMVLLTVPLPFLGSGNPPPEVIWLHNGNEIQESEDFHFEQRGAQHSLCIQEVFPEDRGTYTCEAWNSAGEVRSQAVLTVQGEAEPQQGEEGQGSFWGLSQGYLEGRKTQEPALGPSSPRGSSLSCDSSSG